MLLTIPAGVVRFLGTNYLELEWLLVYGSIQQRRVSGKYERSVYQVCFVLFSFIVRSAQVI